MASTSWSGSNGCKAQVGLLAFGIVLRVLTVAQITACHNGGSDAVCLAAQDFCNDNVFGPLAGNWDVYYVLALDPDPYPPQLDNYLTDPAVTSKIGSQSEWQETNLDVYDSFAATGDWTRSSSPDLERVINEGVRTVIYVGDADYIVNFIGVEAMVRAPSPLPFVLCPPALIMSLCAQIASLNTKFSSLLEKQEFANFTVNGVSAGLYKNAGTFSYVRFFGAGHQVPAYEWPNVPRGAAALQMFTQIMSNHQLSGT